MPPLKASWATTANAARQRRARAASARSAASAQARERRGRARAARSGAMSSRRRAGAAGGRRARCRSRWPGSRRRHRSSPVVDVGCTSCSEGADGARRPRSCPEQAAAATCPRSTLENEIVVDRARRAGVVDPGRAAVERRGARGARSRLGGGHGEASSLRLRRTRRMTPPGSVGDSAFAGRAPISRRTSSPPKIAGAALLVDLGRGEHDVPRRRRDRRDQRCRPARSVGLGELHVVGDRLGAVRREAVDDLRVSGAGTAS